MPSPLPWASLSVLQHVAFAVQVWTINSREQMLEMMALGVDAIITDRPLLLQRLLDQRAAARSCD